MSSELPPSDHQASEEGQEPITPPPPDGEVGHKIPSGRLMLGVVLLAGGILWLLGTVDVFDVSVWVVLSIMLIVVGLALLAGSRTGSHGGLVALGVVLVVVLGVGSSFDVHLRGGIGYRTFSPTSVNELNREYRLGIGQLTLDFSQLALSPGRYSINAHVGIGQLVLRLPPGQPRVGGSILAKAGVGDVKVLDKEDSGFDAAVDLSSGLGGRGDGVNLIVELSVGVGQVTVDGG